MTEPKRVEMSASQADELLQRLAAGRLNATDYELLGVVLKSWLWLSGVVRDNRISIQELKKLIFGARTEKTRKVVKSGTKEGPNEKNDAPKDKPEGHGRNGSDAYSHTARGTGVTAALFFAAGMTVRGLQSACNHRCHCRSPLRGRSPQHEA